MLDDGFVLFDGRCYLEDNWALMEGRRLGQWASEVHDVENLDAI